MQMQITIDDLIRIVRERNDIANCQFMTDDEILSYIIQSLSSVDHLIQQIIQRKLNLP
jgi:hypothetical protein